MLNLGKSMKSVVRQLLDEIGLGQAARRLRNTALAEAKARGWTSWTPQVDAESFYKCSRNAIQTLRQRDPNSLDYGDYLEFGVSRGTSLAAMHRALADEGWSQTRLFGFDSFEGMPPDADKEGWPPGGYASTLSATTRYLTRGGVDWKRVTLTKGWFKDTLTSQTKERLGLKKASLLMVDCDLYSASKEVLWFCEPLIKNHAVIFFDDWACKTAEKTGLGQREAFAEFLTAFPDISSEPLPNYSLPPIVTRDDPGRDYARVFLVTRQRH
jgi:hypothetical protein